MTDTSRELEHEAATSRARLSGLLDELRFRVSPGEVVERPEHVDLMAKNSGSRLHAVRWT